jgi:hypothetical protein
MREDMARVIVERPRINPRNTRKERARSFDELPQHEGMRRAQELRGDRKQLNENLAPLRRLPRKPGRAAVEQSLCGDCGSSARG